ncbi:hypothetical protein CCHR01_12750 [Colletotrichum chrysophilum]|uniref:Uncharacterized protein n=1 Tax=Colletotrichum chrysophilum TaxID=1836956 RepID=A0AAD9ABH1_9PEZI|nr:hypothetical protein CCHR01_12750 [Colletotrichum chrysophilum]
MALHGMAFLHSNHTLSAWVCGVAATLPTGLHRGIQIEAFLTAAAPRASYSLALGRPATATAPAPNKAGEVRWCSSAVETYATAMTLSTIASVELLRHPSQLQVQGPVPVVLSSGHWCFICSMGVRGLTRPNSRWLRSPPQLRVTYDCPAGTRFASLSAPVVLCRVLGRVGVGVVSCRA